MGRGRAKAKQTKVARELKYSSHGTDLEALQRELAGGQPPSAEDSLGDEEGIDGIGDESWASSR
jgi:hypothetical protein